MGRAALMLTGAWGRPSSPLTARQRVGGVAPILLIGGNERRPPQVLCTSCISDLRTDVVLRKYHQRQAGRSRLPRLGQKPQGSLGAAPMTHGAGRHDESAVIIAAVASPLSLSRVPSHCTL